MTTSRSIFSLAIAMASILFTPNPALAGSVTAPGEELAKICIGDYCAECWGEAGFHQCRIEKVGSGCYIEWNDKGDVFAECYDETTPVGGSLACDFPRDAPAACEVNGVPFDPEGREACVGEACVGCNTADDVGSEKFYLECYACLGACCCGATCTTNDGWHCTDDGCSGCG